MIPIRNNLFANKVTALALPRTLSVLFKLIHIFFLLDLGVYEYKTFKIKCIVKFLTISGSLTISVVCFSFMVSNLSEHTFVGWYAFFITTYIFVVLFFNLSNRMTFVEFYKTLLRFDANYGIDSNEYKFNFKIIFVTILFIANRMVLSFVYCSYYPQNCIRPRYAQIIFMLPWLTLDVLLTTNMFLFYTTYCRIAKFPMLIKNSMNIVALRNSYKLIVDSLEKTQKSFDIVVSCFKYIFPRELQPHFIFTFELL